MEISNLMQIPFSFLISYFSFLVWGKKHLNG